MILTVPLYENFYGGIVRWLNKPQTSRNGKTVTVDLSD